MLHGDGQYAPENLPDLVDPLVRGEADAVFGSRLLEKGAARRGGMPLYKLAGNKILTAFENRMAGVDLSEWHSGYRAYSVAALRDLPFERNDDDFNFDTQIIIQLVEASRRVVELPIPTFYGDEICYVNGLKYARLITRDVLRYRAHKMGFGSGELAFASDAYEAKRSPNSSHGRITRWMSERPPSRVLDLGCADGYLAAELRASGHHVVGVDMVAADGVKERVDRFVQGDLDEGVPPEVAGPFDVVVAADVVEHVRRPESILDQLHDLLSPSGVVIVSVPNFAHWYPRLRVLAGRFDYDNRGILDRTHLRFYTRRSFEQLVRERGWEIARRGYTGLPLDVADRGGGIDRGPGSTGRSRDDSGRGMRSLRGLVERADGWAVRARPTVFAYQLLYQLTPAGRAGCFSSAQ
jgi:methionine biosynthesis protein MetW